jgi:hypothetical protein
MSKYGNTTIIAATTIVILAVIVAVTYLAADKVLQGSDVMTVVILALAAVGIGGTVHTTGSVINGAYKSQHPEQQDSPAG